jgi:signal transduction histidine kinase
MRAFWNRVGGPHSLTWFTFAVLYPIVLAMNIVGSGVDLRDHFWQLSAAAVISATALSVTLLIGKVTVLRKSRVKPVPIRFLLVLIVGLLVRAWVFDYLLLAWEMENQERFFYRLSASFATLGITVVFGGYLTALAVEYSLSSRALRATNDALVHARAGVDSRIAEKREALIADVRSQLTQRLDNLRNETPDRALQELRATIEDVVRPVSHDLDRQVTEVTGPAPESPTARIMWPKVLSNSTLGQPIRPLIFSVWSFISALFFAPRLWGFWQGITVSVIVGVVPYLILFVIRPFWGRIAGGRTAPVRAMIFTSVLFVLSLIGTSVAGVVSGLINTFVPLILPQTGLWVLTGWVTAVLPSLRDETQRVLAELDEVSVRLKEELVRINTAYRLQQKAIARALHGPIQDAMSVGSFKLAAAIQNGTATPELVDEVRELISGTLALLEREDKQAPSLERSLEDFAELWEGMVDLSWEIDPGAAQTLEEHYITAATATELVREAISNSVRHGAAKSVLIEVFGEESNLALRVSNDGKPYQPTDSTGLGTTLLNELSLGWNIGQVGNLTVLNATIPVI